MRILIIEDTRPKMNDIIQACRRILDDPSIDIAVTRNEGLLEYRSALKCGEPYDVVITDDLLPIEQGEYPEPFAEDILREINRLDEVYDLQHSCIKIVCSSDEFRSNKYAGKYEFVHYNPSIVLDDRLKEILKAN